jgi:hypothetical protein
VTWPEAATAIGIAWAFAFALWVMFRYGFEIKFRDPARSGEDDE